MRTSRIIATILAASIAGAAWCVTPCQLPDSLPGHHHDPGQYYLEEDTLPEAIVIAQLNKYQEIIPSQKLQGKQLEGLSSNSVADALRYFSGVQLKDYGGVGGVKTLDIRSMGTNHLAVSYDGIQLGNAQNGQIDLGKYSMDNIEMIELYNGQKSRILQPARDFGGSGSVYISTRRPRFPHGERTHVSVTYRSGSFGLQNPSARLEWRLSRNVSLSANVEYTYANGRYRFRYRKRFSDGTMAWDTTATRRNGDLHALRAEAGVFGAYHGGRWMAKAYYYDSERGIPGAIVNNVWKNSQRQWDRNFFVQGTWQHTASDRYVLLANAKWARDYMHYLNPDTTLMYINNRFHQDELYLSLAQKYSLTEHWDVSLSTDYMYNHLKADLANFAYPSRNTLFASLASAIDLGWFKAQGSVLGTFVWDRTRVSRSSLARFTPAVFTSFEPWGPTGLTIRAFFKRAFRMPTFNDLYYTDIGNSALKPEYATQWNLGLGWRPLFSGLFRYLHLTGDAYHNRISDKIIAVPKGTGQYRWMMMNIGRVRIWGLDVAAETEMALPWGINLTGRLSYTFQSARDYTDPEDNLDAAGTYKGQIAYIPKHSGSVIAGATWKALDLHYSFIYVGERWHNSSNIPANYEQPWYTHDLSATYTIPLGRAPMTLQRAPMTLRVTLEVNNLLDQQYEVIQNYPMPGRNYRLTLRFDI